MIIVITGPTCMGKSETALEVARVFDCEIVNGDAFQCYKEMNTGVAKPPKEYFDVVPHHLFSFVDNNGIDSILLILREIILSLMNFIALFSLFSNKSFKGLNVSL